jgi:hypothetical protein
VSKDPIGCTKCGGNYHNADECKRFAGERERFEAWYERTYGVRAFAQNVDHSYTEPTTEMIWAGWQARAAQPAPVVPDEATEGDAPRMSADTEPELAWRDGWNACRDAMLAAAPAQGQQVDRWIPVSERLPELDTPVWLYDPDVGTFFGMRESSTDGWMWVEGFGVDLLPSGPGFSDITLTDCEPTKWMPLPAAPTQGGDV